MTIKQNVSYLIRPNLYTASAFDKTIANATSKNPINTLKVFIQPPDLGSDFNQVGKIANSAKGTPRASPNPIIAELNCKATADPDPEAVSPVLAKAAPKTGPVQETILKQELVP